MTFSDAVVTLKADLLHAINQSIATFKNQTGMTPSSIDIPMFDVTKAGDRTKEYTVGDVRVGFGEY